MNKYSKEPYFSREVLNKILNVTNYKKKVFVPNEFFDDLVNSDDFNKKKSTVKGRDKKLNTYEKKANANHLAFAFCYLYLISYMFRYAIYKYINENDEECFIDERMIYMLCDTSPTSRGKDGVNYITKKGGLLEKMGYIKKINDYPMSYFINEELSSEGDLFLDFAMYSDTKNDILTEYVKPKNLISYPQKAFHMHKEAEEGHYYDGYFYMTHNTTEININVFIYCMSRKEIGKLGFYVFSFLKSKCDYFKATTGNGKYTRKIEDLSNDTGVGKTKLIEILKILEEHNMISNSHNPFVLGLPQGKKVPANSYVTNSYENFFINGKKQIKTRKVLSYEQYDAKIGAYINEKVENGEHDIDINLPLDF